MTEISILQRWDRALHLQRDIDSLEMQLQNRQAEQLKLREGLEIPELSDHTEQLMAAALLRGGDSYYELSNGLQSILNLGAQVEAHQGELAAWGTTRDEEVSHSLRHGSTYKTRHYVNMGILAADANLVVSAGGVLRIPLQSCVAVKTEPTEADKEINNDNFLSWPLDIRRHTPPIPQTFGRREIVIYRDTRVQDMPLLLGNQAVQAAIAEQKPHVKAKLQVIEQAITQAAA